MSDKNIELEKPSKKNSANKKESKDSKPKKEVASSKAKKAKKENPQEEAKAEETPQEEAKAEETPQEEEKAGDSKDGLPEIKLSGLMGTKIGMTQTIMDDGEIIPTTVIKLGPCLALEKKTVNHKTSLKVGYLDTRPRLLNKSQLSYFSKLNVKPVKHIKEFDLLNPEVEISPGMEIKADMFQPGDITDVTSKSKGKGFTGVIKRHNFAGLNHTHGTPQNQRSGGSIGNAAYPARVWKGKKMPGRYGGKTSTTQGLQVLKVDLNQNIIFIKGSVPGFNGSIVYVNHTRKG